MNIDPAYLSPTPDNRFLRFCLQIGTYFDLTLTDTLPALIKLMRHSLVKTDCVL